MSTQTTEKKTFFNDLWDRRFFQYFATYIAASWGAIQFLEWIVRRYDMPSIWVDKLVILLLCLLPFIISLIYFHGRVGDDKWHKFEKIAYPINIIFALGMSIFAVTTSAEDMTEEITITNEEGLEEIREVPTMEYIEKVVIFPVETETDIIDWKGIGMGVLLDLELEQDMRVTGVNPLNMTDEYADYGFDKLQKIPFTTKFNIAEALYSNYFVTIDAIEGDTDHIMATVYSSTTGKLIGKKEIKEQDIFSAIDVAAEFVNSKIKSTPTEGKTMYVDLPSTNLITGDTSAFKNYMQAMTLFETNPSSTSKMSALLQQSVKDDPTCSECWALYSYVNLLDAKDEVDQMDNAFKFIDNLPERQQLNIKYLNYLIENDVEKSIKLCEMWAKLYPHDVKPYQNRINLLRQTFLTNEAKLVAKEAIDNGHKGSMYLTYARLLIDTKDWVDAEVYLKKYKDAYPKQYEAGTLLVDVYKGKGQIDKAVAELENLMLMRPNDNDLVSKKADLLAKQNQFEESIKTMNTTLAKLTTTQDSVKNYLEQLTILNRAMRYKEYASVRRALKQTFMRKFPPIAFVQTEFQTVGFYKDIGLTDSIAINIAQLENNLPPTQKERLIGINKYMVDLMEENAETIDQSYEEARPIFEASGNNLVVLLNGAEIAFVKKDYEKTIDYYQQMIEEFGKNFDLISMKYHQAHYELGKYKEGLEVIEDFLNDDPLHPNFNLYKALYLNQLDKKAEAKSTLLKVWPAYQNSDQRYTYTKKANELAKGLGIL